MKKIYFQKSFSLGILKISIYVLGWARFNLRTEISWGWNN